MTLLNNAEENKIFWKRNKILKICKKKKKKEEKENVLNRNDSHLSEMPLFGDSSFNDAKNKYFKYYHSLGQTKNMYVCGYPIVPAKKYQL